MIYVYFPFRNVESQVFKGLASSDEKFSNTPIYRTNKNVDRMDWITVSFLNADKLETGCKYVSCTGPDLLAIELGAK